MPNLKKDGRDGHATCMAGEFFVMAQLYRLGHLPALTLGNAKTVDILVQTKSNRKLAVSVKSVQGGYKWSVGKMDWSRRSDVVFVFLLFDNFDDPLATPPRAWVMAAPDVEARKKPWINGNYAIFYKDKLYRPADLEKFASQEAWAVFN